MSSHKDDAKEFMIAAGVRGYSTDQNLAAAQVHATLHLAEQQRIGNLIAYTVRATLTYGDREILQEQIKKELGL